MNHVAFPIVSFLTFHKVPSSINLFPKKKKKKKPTIFLAILSRAVHGLGLVGFGVEPSLYHLLSIEWSVEIRFFQVISWVGQNRQVTGLGLQSIMRQ